MRRPRTDGFLAGRVLRRYGRGVVGFMAVRGTVVQCFVQSYGVVEGLSVIEDAQPCLLQISEPLMIRPFVFQRPEESLHHGVVVAAAATAHRTGDASRLR